MNDGWHWCYTVCTIGAYRCPWVGNFPKQTYLFYYILKIVPKWWKLHPFLSFLSFLTYWFISQLRCISEKIQISFQISIETRIIFQVSQSLTSAERLTDKPNLLGQVQQNTAKLCECFQIDESGQLGTG